MTDIAVANDRAWLVPWISLLKERHGAALHCIELGAGSGWDTQVLRKHGIPVVALDKNRSRLQELTAQGRSSAIAADMCAPLPFRNSCTPFVLASLSLHYFTWAQSVAIVRRINNLLVPGGSLLVRINSVSDVNFGAGQGEQIEPNLYINPGTGELKRFFSLEDVHRLFNDFRLEFLAHREIDRYGKTKCCWEFLATRCP